MDYAALFNKLEQRLNANDLITHKIIFSNPPANDSTISRFVDSIQLPIPEDFTAFYQSINGFMLVWRYLNEDIPMHVNGCSNITSLDDMLSYNAKPKRYGLGHLSDLLKDNFWVFDSLQNDHYILVKFQPDSYSFHLCLPNAETFALDLTLSEYFENICRCGAIFCWQAYLTMDQESMSSRMSYDMFIEHAEKIFPEQDITGKMKLNVEPVKKKPYTHFQKPNLLKLTDTAFDPNKYHIDLLRFEKEPGVSFAAVRKVEIQIKQKLPEDFVAFFYLMNGLNVYWKHHSESKDIVGNFRILPFEMIFGGPNWYDKKVWNNNVFKYFKLDKTYDKSLKDYYPLYIDDTGYIIFRFEKNQFNLKLWNRMPLVNIRLSFREFIFEMLNCRGTAFWQYFLTDRAEYHIKDIAVNVPEQIIEIFGDTDLSNLRSYSD